VVGGQLGENHSLYGREKEGKQKPPFGMKDGFFSAPGRTRISSLDGACDQKKVNKNRLSV